MHRAYAILDELIIAGELQESSKKAALRSIGQADSIEEWVGLFPSSWSDLTFLAAKARG